MADIKQTQMIFKSSIVTEFKKSKLKDIDSVPVGNSKAVDMLFDDGERNEFISTTKFGEDFPADLNPWTQIVLTKEWATSFADHINKVPKPLFIPGHKETGVGYKERAIPDGYLVGAMVSGNVLYLRNSLPNGETPDQMALISQTLKEIKAGMLSTSLTDVMEYKIVVDEAEDTAMYYAIASLKGQTNALVEEDQTASEAEIIITSFKAESDSSGENEEGVERMGENKTMSNEEVFVILKNQLESGRLSLKNVTEGLGVEMITTEQKIALKRLGEAEKVVGDIAVFVAGTVANREATFRSLKESKIKDKFKSDELIEIATSMFSLTEGTAETVDAEVLRLSELKVFKTIQGKLAAAVGYVPDNSDADVENSNTDNNTMEG